MLAYDGTEFDGWQIQPGRRTVQGVVEDALREALEEDDVKLAGAGRTDAGVHARGQVASFRSGTRLPARALAPRLSRRLPGDVRVRAAEEVDPGFHARHSARARRYAYRVLAHDDVLAGRFAWWPRRPLDRDALARAVRPLEGEHDCSAFRATGSSPGSPRCRIFRASWSREEHGLRLDIVADHFLYHMVRNVVGTAFQAARAADPGAALREVLRSGDRGRAGVTVPAHGLCLEEVFYAGEARA